MRSLVDIVADLADALDGLQVRFALGRALATSYWGVARTTQDIDCLAAISALKYQELAEAFQSLGYKQRDSAGGFIDPSARLMRGQATDRKLMEFFATQSASSCFFPSCRFRTRCYAGP